MFQTLVSRNTDLGKLVERGYAVGFDNGYLIVRDIPYLDDRLELRIGAIVTKLEFIDQDHVRQNDHQVFFAGGVPHNLDGGPIPNLGGGATSLALSEENSDVIVERSFSNKPRSKGAFDDFYHKIESYVGIICGPAIERYAVTPYTFRVRTDGGSESPFKFHDTLTSRAEILDLSSKFKNDIIAIIGVGGTGAYVLDFLAKVPVKEIRLFDRDVFHVHNAYRSPGSTNAAEFRKPKVEVYTSRYATFRNGIIPVARVIDSSSSNELQGVTFAFVCVDKGSSRAGVFDALIANGIPFMDVGMGLNRKQGSVNGMLRVTYYSAEQAAELRNKGLAEFADHPNDEYRTNIQIGELNALNACIAVIKFKQLRGFYYQEKPLIDILFEIADLKVVGESEIDAF